MAQLPKKRQAPLKFPEDLTVLPSRELGKKYSYYTAELALKSDLLAFRRNDLQNCKTELRYAKARAMVSARGIKAQKIASMFLDPAVQDLIRQLNSISADLTLLQAFVWTIKDYLRALEFERDRRIQANKLGEDYG